MDKITKLITPSDFGTQICAKKNSEDSKIEFIEGYGSTFNNIDRVGDVVLPGAFSKTIAERVPAGKVKLMAKHYAFGGDVMETVGTIIEAKEDSRGLWYKAKVAETDFAQQIASLASDGHISSNSIGYQIMDAAPVVVDGKEAYGLKELKLFEITLTNNPANELADLLSAKSANILSALDGANSPEAKGRILSALGGEEQAKSILDILDNLSKAVTGLVANPEPKIEEAPEAPEAKSDNGSRLREVENRKRNLSILNLEI